MPANIYRLNDNMSRRERALWYLGWNPAPCLVLTLGLAVTGWLLAQHPLGLLLGLPGLWLRLNATRLINEQFGHRRQQAEEAVRMEGIKRLNINSNEVQCYVLTAGSGSSPFGVRAPATLQITAVFLCDTFFAVYPQARFRFPDLSLELPDGGEEIYYRYVSAVDYQPPVLQVHLSNRQTKQFNVGGERSATLLSDLRTRLRGVASAVELKLPNPTSGASSTADDAKDQIRPSPAPDTGEGTANSATASPEAPTDVNEPRYCYLRLSRLQQLYQDPIVLDTLIEQLGVPGKVSVLKQLTPREQQEAIEAEIDHFNRTPTSVWYGVPKLEVLAASIWRAGVEGDLRLNRKLVREKFCAVGCEEDLRNPVARWLQRQGYEPYMEVPLGRRRIDLLGWKKPGVLGSDSLLAVELKNDDAQFSRAIDQMGTFAEYANAVYLACTPAFAAEYLDRNADGRGIKHWDPGVMDRKLTAGGYGLLIVERDIVFEVIKPVERTPSRDRVANALRSLSGVMRVEC